MNEASHDRRRSTVRSLYHLVRNGLPLEPETALYILMSTADVFMTWYLLYNGASNDRTWFVESNPIPRYFLESWGFNGLVYFKFALVAFVAVICQVIARTKLDVARRVLNLATLLVTGVVIYSVVLMVQHG
jgi:hypothetical protein